MDIRSLVLSSLEKPPLPVIKENEDNKKENFPAYSSAKQFQRRNYYKQIMTEFRRRNSYKESMISDSKPFFDQELTGEEKCIDANTINTLFSLTFNVNNRNDTNLNIPASDGVSNNQQVSDSSTDKELDTDKNFKRLYKRKTSGKRYKLPKQYLDHNYNHREKTKHTKLFAPEKRKLNKSSKFSALQLKSIVTKNDTIIDANGKTFYKRQFCDKINNFRDQFLNRNKHRRNKNAEMSTFQAKTNLTTKYTVNNMNGSEQYCYSKQQNYKNNHKLNTKFDKYSFVKEKPNKTLELSTVQPENNLKTKDTIISVNNKQSFNPNQQHHKNTHKRSLESDAHPFVEEKKKKHSELSTVQPKNNLTTKDTMINVNGKDQSCNSNQHDHKNNQKINTKSDKHSFVKEELNKTSELSTVQPKNNLNTKDTIINVNNEQSSNSNQQLHKNSHKRNLESDANPFVEEKKKLSELSTVQPKNNLTTKDTMINVNDKEQSSNSKQQDHKNNQKINAKYDKHSFVKEELNKTSELSTLQPKNNLNTKDTIINVNDEQSFNRTQQLHKNNHKRNLESDAHPFVKEKKNSELSTVQTMNYLTRKDNIINVNSKEHSSNSEDQDHKNNQKINTKYDKHSIVKKEPNEMSEMSTVQPRNNLTTKDTIINVNDNEQSSNSNKKDHKNNKKINTKDDQHSCIKKEPNETSEMSTVQSKNNLTNTILNVNGKDHSSNSNQQDHKNSQKINTKKDEHSFVKEELNKISEMLTVQPKNNLTTKDTIINVKDREQSSNSNQKDHKNSQKINTKYDKQYFVRKEPSKTSVLSTFQPKNNLSIKDDIINVNKEQSFNPNQKHHKNNHKRNLESDAHPFVEEKKTKNSELSTVQPKDHLTTKDTIINVKDKERFSNPNQQDQKSSHKQNTKYDQHSFIKKEPNETSETSSVQPKNNLTAKDTIINVKGKDRFSNPNQQDQKNSHKLNTKYDQHSCIKKDPNKTSETSTVQPKNNLTTKDTIIKVNGKDQSSNSNQQDHKNNQKINTKYDKHYVQSNRTSSVQLKNNLTEKDTIPNMNDKKQFSNPCQQDDKHNHGTNVKSEVPPSVEEEPNKIYGLSTVILRNYLDTEDTIINENGSEQYNPNNLLYLT